MSILKSYTDRMKKGQEWTKRQSPQKVAQIIIMLLNCLPVLSIRSTVVYQPQVVSLSILRATAKNRIGREDALDGKHPPLRVHVEVGVFLADARANFSH